VRLLNKEFIQKRGTHNMGNFLHALGATAFKHKGKVLLFWLVLLTILGVAAVHFIKPPSSAIAIPGTEAQKTLDRFAELFPNGGKGSGQVVFEVPAGKKITDYKMQVAALLDKVSKTNGVTSVISPFDNPYAISVDGTIAYATVQLKNKTNDSAAPLPTDIARLTEASRQSSGLTIEVNGDLAVKGLGEIIGVSEIFGVVLALVVLTITLGSLIAAGMPVISALIAVGISLAGLFSLSNLISIDSTTPVLGIMLGLAVGIDYALFVINRYRSLLLEGYTYEQAVSRSIATAGNAVLFAAATVVIALSALTVIQIPFITTMGLTGAATVAVAAIVTITLIPALLGFARARVFAGKTRRAIETAQRSGPHHTDHVLHTTFWYKWGLYITKHRNAALIISVFIIGVLAIPALSLKLGLPTDQYASTKTTGRKAYDLVAKGFGAGANGPLLLVVEGLPKVTTADKDAVRASIMQQYNAQVAQQTAAQTNLLNQEAALITTPAQAAAFQQKVAEAKAAGQKQQEAALTAIDKQVEQYASLRQLSLVADRIAKVKDVKLAIPAATTDNGSKGIIQVVAATAPADQATLNLISYLRDSNNQKTLGGSMAVTIGVTGQTALESDINHKLAAALPVYLAVIVGLSFILLVIAFRSIIIPIKATLGFLLSVVAMLGVMVAAFQWGWFGITDAPGPIISFLPIILTGILFGLAMDYEFFLVSSMHEAHLATKDAQKAVLRGFSLGSKVVTAAAIIMISIFAGFIFSHDSTIQ
jgi:RND superfamily putative drug exporter